MALNSSEPNYRQPFGSAMVGRWRKALSELAHRVQGGADCHRPGSQFSHGSELPAPRLSASLNRGWRGQKGSAISEPKGKKKAVEQSEWAPG